MSSKQQTSTGPVKSKRGPRSRRNRQATKSTSGVVTHKQLSGFKYSPLASIPESTPRPWYPIVVSYTGAPGDTTAPYLYKAFCDQIDKSCIFIKGIDDRGTSGSVDVRFQRVEVWNLTGRALSLTVWDPPAQDTGNAEAGSNYDQLGGWTDAGSSSEFPRIGYSYPLSVQTTPHEIQWNKGTGFKVVTTTASSNSDTLLLRYHLLWRVPGPVVYTTVIPPPADFTYLRTGSLQIRKEVVKQADRLLVKLQAIKEAIPSKLGLEEEFEELTLGIEDLRVQNDEVDNM